MGTKEGKDMSEQKQGLSRKDTTEGEDRIAHVRGFLIFGINWFLSNYHFTAMLDYLLPGDAVLISVIPSILFNFGCGLLLSSGCPVFLLPMCCTVVTVASFIFKSSEAAYSSWNAPDWIEAYLLLLMWVQIFGKGEVNRLQKRFKDFHSIWFAPIKFLGFELPQWIWSNQVLVNCKRLFRTLLTVVLGPTEMLMTAATYCVSLLRRMLEKLAD